MTETTLETVRQAPFPFQLFAATEAVANSRTGSITRKNYELCTVEYVSAGAGGLEINGHSYHPVRDSVYVLSQYSTHTYWPERKKHRKLLVPAGSRRPRQKTSCH